MPKRWGIFVASVIIQSAGIALVVRGNLGTSPISSLPYVASLIAPLTFGQTTFVFNMMLLAGQIAMLRRKFRPLQLMQIPVTILFSYCIDVFMAMFAPLVTEIYPLQILLLLAGTTLISLSVAWQGIADVLMVPGEGFVYAASSCFKKDLGRTKTAFDCALTLMAAIMSLSFLGGIEGIREGTLISAGITGSIAKFFLHRLGRTDKNGKLQFRF